MTENNQQGYWTEKVEVKYHPPVGTFKQNAAKIVNNLLAGAQNNAHLALQRLTFYVKRAGSKLENSEELEKAKTMLEKLINQNKH
jgi:hypothetical protein